MADAPPRRQRLAAYAVLRRREDVLLARIATHIHEDLWTLPGGGVDHGEDPRDAVAREVHEESGLRVRVGRVLEVHSRHFTGVRPDGRVEDFHGAGLIFDAEVLPESRDVDPHVVEIDGTTREIAWVPGTRARDLPLSSTARQAISALGVAQEEHA